MANKTREDFKSNLEYFKYKHSYENHDKVVLDEEFIEGVELLKRFGFEVLLTENTFTTWYKDKRQSGFSTHALLNVEYITNYIIKFFGDIGFEKGKESKAKEMRNVLGL